MQNYENVMQNDSLFKFFLYFSKWCGNAFYGDQKKSTIWRLNNIENYTMKMVIKLN
jgi:hypothetical protein